ncbi:Lar family restriction alleviation protein [Enterococcus faecalis]|nr:Lar family restriction alleviation protein [Enterococcus faecalis]
MSEIHIKPCPFCGSENISFNAFSILSDAYVLCEQCNASIEISAPWDDMDEKEHDKVCFEKLLVLWNKRASKSNQPELNENQQVVLEWLKREHFDSYIKSVLSNLYFYVNMTAIGDLENKEIQEMVNAYEKLSQEDFAQVLKVFSQWALEQEEK